MPESSPLPYHSYPPFVRLLNAVLGPAKEVDKAEAELLAHGSHAAADARRNSTAPSKKSDELKEKVDVRPVNPSLGDQDGEERVTSIADSCEVNGDVGTKKQGTKGSEKLKGLANVELQAGASKLNPLVIEGSSESDSEPPATINPSSAREGSLLHALYLQLVVADKDGITVREIFKCLKEPAEMLGFGIDWKVQMRRHLKTNPYFCEEKGYHYLVCNHQQPSKKSSQAANTAGTSRRYGASSTVPSSQHLTKPATVQPGLSVDTHEGVIQTRRKAFLKANAALSEQVKEEFEDMQIMPSPVVDPTDSQLVSHTPHPTSNRKRKSSSNSSHDEELAHHGHPIPGCLQGTQAETLPKSMTNLHHNEDDSSIVGLPGSHPNLHQSLRPLLPKSAAIFSPISREVAKSVVDKPATGVSNHDDDSDGEQLHKNVPESPRHVAV